MQIFLKRLQLKRYVSVPAKIKRSYLCKHTVICKKGSLNFLTMNYVSVQYLENQQNVCSAICLDVALPAPINKANLQLLFPTQKLPSSSLFAVESPFTARATMVVKFDSNDVNSNSPFASICVYTYQTPSIKDTE